MNLPRTKPKRYRLTIKTSSYEVEVIVDLLARAREHLVKGRSAMCASLIQQAENKLDDLGKEEG